MLNPNDKAEEIKTTLDTKEVEEISLDRMRWANRRRMAWVFSYAAIIFSFLILTSVIIGKKELNDRISQSTDILTWCFMGLISIPSLYFGGTVLEKFTGSTSKVAPKSEAQPVITPG